MKQGKVTPHRSFQPSLTMNVKTRTPLEAFQMLRQGHPIDQMSAYYDDQGLLPDDYWMLDKVGKLHKLAQLRSKTEKLQTSIATQQAEIDLINSQQIQKDDENKQAVTSQTSQATAQVEKS